MPPSFAMPQAVNMLRYIPLLRRLAPEEKCWIFELLSLPSKACVALTCKPLLSMFGAVLKNKEFAFPHADVNFWGGTEFDHNSRARTELLLRLQTNPWWGPSWKYCGACLKLHSRDQFPPTPLGDYEPSPDLACRDPGIVALCPCIHLNASEKVRLIKDLEAGKVKNASNWHKCSIDYPNVGNVWDSDECDSGDSDGEDVTVNITIALSLTELGELVVRTQYVVRPGIVRDLELWHVMCCPHRDIFDYLREDPEIFDTYCWLCQTTLHVDCSRDDQSSLQVTRYLGRKSPPACRTWRRQVETRYSYIHR
jgi:hypothetical protein